MAGYGVDTIAIILFYFKRFFEKFSKIRIPVRIRRPGNPFLESENSAGTQQKTFAVAN